MEMNGGFLVTKIKQLGDRIFEKILSEKNIDAFNGAQGRILYVVRSYYKIDSYRFPPYRYFDGKCKTTSQEILNWWFEKYYFSPICPRHPGGGNFSAADLHRSIGISATPSAF